MPQRQGSKSDIGLKKCGLGEGRGESDIHAEIATE